MLFNHHRGSSSRPPTALVTGADSRGIGRAIALRLATEGADLALHWYRDRARAEELAGEIGRLGRAAHLVHADMGDPAAARTAIRQGAEALGGLSILVCNAAHFQRKPFLDITDEEWSRIHAVNLHGYFACAQEAACIMVSQGAGGRIVMISSVNQAHANPNLAHYVATKGGVMMLARAMALELAEQGITVNLVAPGSIETDLNRAIFADPETRAQKVTPIPMRRAGSPEEVADAVHYLAGEGASYVTGSTIVVDGGLTIS